MHQPVRTVLKSALPMAAAICVSGLCAAQEQLPAGTIDFTAPMLRSINVTGIVNAELPNQSIQVDLDIKDDLSGVLEYEIMIESPSGKRMERIKHVAAPSLHVTPSLTVGSTPNADPDFEVFDVPGTWRVISAYAIDANNNRRDYDESQLAALGVNTFTFVSNGYDFVAPTLASGTINTPTIRRSKPPKGTPPGTPPYVSAALSITDAGNGRISGTWAGSFRLCHVTSGQCDDDLILTGESIRTGLEANTLSFGTQIRANQTLGQYVIVSLAIVDVAGNEKTYLSTAFGGETNFATFFPTGATIFINQ